MKMNFLVVLLSLISGICLCSEAPKKKNEPLKSRIVHVFFGSANGQQLIIPNVGTTHTIKQLKEAIAKSYDLQSVQINLTSLNRNPLTSRYLKDTALVGKALPNIPIVELIATIKSTL